MNRRELWPSHEAIAEAVGRKAAAVAKALHLSMSLIYKWAQPSQDWSDSGAFNPLDRLEGLIEAALKEGNGAASYAPIRWLNERFGFVAVKIPDEQPCNLKITRSVAIACREFGELMGEIEASIGEDGEAGARISRKEARRVSKEGKEAVRQIMELIHLVEEAAG